MHEHITKPKIEDIIETLHAVREVCSRYEKKYKMLSEQFFELYSKGLLDDDGLNYDFVDWAGSYKTVIEAEGLYNESIKYATVDEKLAQIRSHALVS